MKKHLLFGMSAFFALGAGMAQNARQVKPTGVVNMAEMIQQKLSLKDDASSMVRKGNFTPKSADGPTSNSESEKSSSVANFTATFNRISGSENIFGALVSNSKPLDYNDNLNTVTFLHRRSPTYPQTASGTMVFDIYRNMTTWDSTCVWSDATNRGRYPQGGILNPVGNTNLNNAYVVGSGPVTSGSGWIGSFYTYKQIGAAGNSVVPSSTLFVPNTSPFDPTIKKIDFPRYNFAVGDNGVFYTLGSVVNDINSTAPATSGFRGAAIVSGSIVAGNMVYKYDTIIPTTVMHSAGYKVAFSAPWMAWNESGTVGYVMFIGASPSATLRNVGYQPIIFKTTNGGASWTQVQGIDFNANANAPGYSMLLNSLGSPNTNTSITVPFFTPGDGIDLTVDKNNKLHIVGTMVGTARVHPDSLGYTWQYAVPQNTADNGHSWPFVPTAYPYIFDFVGDGSTGNWNCYIIDSLGTEGPGTGTAPGANNNPWNVGANPVTSDSRIQVSRTSDGNFVIYTWAESDTVITTNSYKWNEFPDIKVRVMNVNTMQKSAYKASVTNPTTGFHPRVRNKAYFHYASTRAILNNTCLATNGQVMPVVRVPLVVTNNQPIDPLQPQDNFYSTAQINFCSYTTLGTQSIAHTISGFYAYPNPASTFINLVSHINKESNGTVNVLNLMGQTIYSENVSFHEGENITKVPVQNLAKGIYFINVKAGNQQITHKVIVE